MGDHAIVSPSALTRIGQCPGSVRLSAACPRPPSSDAADFGTRCHEWLEQANRTGVLPEIPDQREKAMVAAAWPYFRDHPARTRPEGLWLPEEKVSISAHLEGFPDDMCWGTADVVAAYKDTLEVIDLKTGYYGVAPDSPQLWAYAFGAARLLLDEEGNWLPNHRQTKYLKLTIVQPTQVPIVRTTGPLPLVENLTAAKESLERTLTAVQDPQAPLYAGDWCRWCAAKDSCPKRTQAALGAVQNMFEPLPEADPQPTTTMVDIVEKIVEERMTESPDTLDADTLGRILDLAPLVQQYLKECQDLAVKRLNKGEEVAGWKLAAGRGSRDWIGGEDATAEALKKLGLKVGDIYTRKIVSPAQAEKLPAIAGSRVRREKLGDLWATKAGKPQLAPESDPRPGVDPRHGMFEAEPEWM